ncbi:MAG: hypothetical protein CVT49_11585 [candidate division Zixibacteria bacterium HGW-Zixibacteria-1]|nr:MAG: hypothetical protein CVT49_11585 [candidate division Zixibacteria bacterium HGW-Zixibacteria-1]
MPLLNEKDFRLTDTIHEAVIHTCRRLADKPALVAQGGEGKAYTFGEIGDLVGRVAGGLRKKGFSKGDRVAIIAENCPEWGISYLAAMAAGCIVVPLDVSLKPNELSRMLRVSKARALICSPRWKKEADDMIALNGLRVDTVAMNFDEGETLKGLADSDPYFEKSVSRSDIAVIIYTSGTTGDPKGVILTHNNILRNIESIVKSLMIYQDDNLLSVLPLHHTFEATVGFLFPLCTGLTVKYSRSLKSRDLMTDIKNNKITFMIGVPLLFEKMYAAINKRISELHPIKRALFNSLYGVCKVGWKFKRRPGIKLFKDLRTKAGLESIRLMACGGAPLPPRVAEWFTMVGFIFLSGYGLTECAPVVSFNRPGDIDFGSVGRPLPGIEVKIDNPAPDGVGEIIVRGENNTPGYIDNPEATAKLLKDGWLFTGDMGKIKHGRVFITGRMKNIIISGGGKNIYPEEIEAELNVSLYILESVVVGRTKEKKAGEDIWAVIVPDMEQIQLLEGKPGAEITSERIRQIIKQEIDAANSRMADYKRITQFEIRLDEFEKTSTRKIKRRFYQ